MLRLCLALLVLGLGLTGQPQAQTPAGPMPLPSPSMGPGVPSPLQPGDAFGEEVTLPERMIAYVSGHTTWGTAFDTLVSAFTSLKAAMDKQGLKAAGPAMTIYTETGDTGFSYRAAYPVAEAPKEPSQDIVAIGPAPSGKALKFVHRGSYDAMDTTYEAITNYLDEKRLDVKDLFIEEYATDPITANPDRLIVNVFVPVK